jgi:hypothetical protein
MVLIKDKKGVALPVVLVLVMIMLLLGITIVSVVEFDGLRMHKLQKYEKALYIAEAGFNKYMWLLSIDNDFYKENKRVNEDEGFEIDSSTEKGFIYKKAEYTDDTGGVLGYYQVEIILPDDNDILGVKSTGWTADMTENRTIYAELKKPSRKITDFALLEGARREPLGASEKISIYGPYFTNGDLYATSSVKFIGNYEVGYTGINRATDAEFINPPVKMDPIQVPLSTEKLIENSTFSFPSSYVMILLNHNMLKYVLTNGYVEWTYDRPVPERGGIIYVPSMDDFNGDVYISGILDGRLTIVADGDIYICAFDPTSKFPNYTGGIKYSDNVSMLALVTKKDIVFLTWSTDYGVKPPGWPIADDAGSHFVGGDGSGLEINGVLCCRTLRTQNLYFDYYEDSITIKGSVIARDSVQRMSIDGKGYTSIEYKYDDRLRDDAPPGFEEWLAQGWEVASWKEIK